MPIGTHSQASDQFVTRTIESGKTQPNERSSKATGDEVLPPDLATEQTESRANLLFDIEVPVGLIHCGESTTRHIEINNTSELDWQLLRIDSPCACTVPVPDFQLIRSQSHEMLKLEYRAPGKSKDDQRTVKLWFHGQPPQLGQIRLQANVRREVNVYPEKAVFGTVARGAAMQQVLRLQNFSDIRWSTVELESSEEWLSATLHEENVPDSNHAAFRPLQEWRVVLQPETSELPSGQNSASVSVKPISQQKLEASAIPVSLTIQRPVSIIPGQMFFGRIQTGVEASARVHLKFATGKCPQKEELILLRSNLDDLKLSLSRLSDCEWTLNASLLMRDASPEVAQPEVVFDLTNDDEPPVAIPVYFLLEESRS